MTRQHQTNWHLYVGPLVENESTWEALKLRYPQILADLTSSKTNPTCSCRGRVASYLNEKSADENELNFLTNLMGAPEVAAKIKKNEEDFKVSQEKTKNFPKIHSVGKTSEDWVNFIKYLEDNNFKEHIKSFSLLEKNDHILVYLM